MLKTKKLKNKWSKLAKKVKNINRIKTSNKPSLYIHIPFCQHLCHYCDFTKFFYQKRWIESYLDTLKNEIASFQQTSFFTIYVGGGTPTSFSVEELTILLEIIKPYSHNVVEYTFECNIESTNEEKLSLLKRYGVNRLSFGVQSTNNQRLEEIGRHHRYEDIVTMIQVAKNLQFNDISVDLIYGLPHQTLTELEKDIDNIIALDINHISTYSLTIHPHTKAYIDRWPVLSDDRSRDYYDLILTKLRKVGFERYEVSNFAKNGDYSFHNHVYWFSKTFYGAGYGASGYLEKEGIHTRYRTIGNFSHYLNGEIEQEKEMLTIEQRELEFLMNNLRLANGFLLSDYATKFLVQFSDKYRHQLDFLVEANLIQVKNGRIRCNDEGLIKLDYVLFKLL